MSHPWEKHLAFPTKSEVQLVGTEPASNQLFVNSEKGGNLVTTHPLYKALNTGYIAIMNISTIFQSFDNHLPSCSS